MNTKTLTIITAAVLVLGLLGFYFFQQTQTPAGPAAITFDGTLDLSGQPFIGGEDATVTVAVFEDFKCPACRNFEENIYPQLKRDYIDDGKIKFHFVNFAIPLGPDSITAAIAGECAFEQNNAAFWEYKTILYRSQGSERQQWATPSRLAELADVYVPDLDSEALKTCVEEERYQERVAVERALGVAAGVQGTPTVFINNQAVTNAFDYNALKAVIDAALGEN